MEIVLEHNTASGNVLEAVDVRHVNDMACNVYSSQVACATFATFVLQVMNH